MKFNQLFICSALAGSMALMGCSGSSDSTTAPAPTPVSTDFKVNINVPDGLSATPVANKSFASILTSFFFSEATAADVSDQLGEGNFKVAIVDSAGIVTALVTPESLTQEADGSWVVTLPGGQRLDCVIIADLSKTPDVKVGEKLPADAIYAPTVSEAFEIDPRSTAAFQQFIEDVADNLNLQTGSGFTETEIAEFMTAVQELPLPAYTPGQTLDQYLAEAIPELALEVEREIFVAQNTDTTFSLADYFGAGGVLNWYGFWGTFERGQFSYTAATQTTNDIEQDFDGTNWVDVALTPSTDALVLTSTGWIANADLDTVTSINADGSFTVSDTIVASAQEKISGTAVNVEGQSIRAFLPEFKDVIPTAAVFSAGAVAYQLSFENLNDSYELDAFDNGAGATATTMLDALGNSFTTLDSVLTPTASTSNDPTQMNLVDVSQIAGSPIALEFVGSGATGTINVYSIDSGTFPAVASVIDTATWERRTVQGTDLIIINAQGNVLGEVDGEEFYMLAVYNGAVSGGIYVPAGTLEADVEYVFNNIGANDINTNFDINNVNPVPLTCSYESSWNNIDDEPATFNSYTDYQQVITACGGANALVAADISGATWVDTDGGNTETFVFKAGGAFDFTETDTATSAALFTATGNWSVANNQLTITIPGEFFDIWTFTAQGQRIYTEDPNWSSNPDLGTLDGVAEGEIWIGGFVPQ